MKITLLIVVLFTNLLWAQWGKITIDDALSHAYELDVADINDDGHLDIIASGNAANVVRWYEAPTWTKHNIDVNLYSAGDVLAYDIDGDDTLDVLAGSGASMDDVVWYKGPDPNWAKNYIHRNLNGTIHFAIGDMDNDGDFDIVAAGASADSVVWFENPSWYRRHIGVINYPRKVKVADINKDDTLDVICTGINEDAVVWYEGPGPIWTKYDIDNNLSYAYGLDIADLDSDSTLDVIAAGADDNSLIWYKWPNWSQTFIDQNLSGASGVCVADIDNDDTLDIVACGYTGDNVVWYKGPDWNKSTIDDNINGPEMVYVIDIDDDGDKDIIVTAWDAGQVILYMQPPIKINDITNNTLVEFTLSQNYPNPFNPATTIEFDLPKTSQVSLKIFNILGEEVTTLVSERLSAGSYEYNWDAGHLASGVYLYRLQAEGFVQTRKMILMK